MSILEHLVSPNFGNKNRYGIDIDHFVSPQR